MNETLQQIRRQLREMWNRRWIGLAAAWIAALVGVVVVYRIPERFEASARVFVDTESVLKPLLQGLAVQPNIDQQVALVSRTLLSRPNVEKVVRMSDLDINLTSDSQRQARIDSMLATIRLGGSPSTGLYQISYRDFDPESARRVVQSLLTIFMESSLGDKRSDSRSAIRFIDDQIKQYEASLQAAEARLKDFRLKYMNVGQRSGGDYFGRVGALGAEIEAAKLELSVAERQRESYRKELAGEQPVFLGESTDQLPEAVPDMDARLAGLRRNLDDLRRRYTDAHPDVTGVKNVISQLEEQRAAELDARRKAAMASSAGKPVRGVDRNPVFQQLRISLAETEATVASAKAKVAGLEQQRVSLVSQAKLLPQIEVELAQLNRDYDVQRKIYESLLSRRESATMGIGVQDSAGAQFRVIDPPRVAPRPVAPNRLALLGVALAISLLIGVAASFLATQLAPTFHDSTSLRNATERPVLGLVSILPSPALTRQRRRRSWLFAGAASGLLAFFAGVAALGLLLVRTAA